MSKKPKIARPTDAGDCAEAYGKLKEGLHLTGYSFERASTTLIWLLKEERWKIGGKFADVNAFLDSIKLDEFRAVAEQRKEIALLIKRLQPAASNRAVARMLGVDESTIRQDTRAGNPAPTSRQAAQTRDAGEATAGNPAPEAPAAQAASAAPPALSGAGAARVVARAERIAERQDTIADRVAKVAFDAQALGKFSVLLADPPWDDEFGRSDRSIENHYPTMRFEAICALPIADIAHDQAMLFLWATPSMLEMALATAKAWDFTYRTMMVWKKPSIGLGKYVRQKHELLLIARRGEHPAPDPRTLPESVIDAPRGEHSEKPEVFHEIIERMYPTCAKIELFRRGTPRQGWSAWGAETAAEAAE